MASSPFCKLKMSVWTLQPPSISAAGHEASDTPEVVTVAESEPLEACVIVGLRILSLLLWDSGLLSCHLYYFNILMLTGQ